MAALGPGCSGRLAVGQRVVATRWLCVKEGNGTWRQYAAVPEEDLVSGGGSGVCVFWGGVQRWYVARQTAGVGTGGGAAPPPEKGEEGEERRGGGEGGGSGGREGGRRGAERGEGAGLCEFAWSKGSSMMSYSEASTQRKAERDRGADAP